MERLKKFVRDDSGSNALEYGLIVGLISLAVVAGATSLGGALGSLFTSLAATMNTVATSIAATT